MSKTIYYKAFDKDLCCRGMQYEVGKTYELTGELKICKNGFHFCASIRNCFDYYPMSKETRFCEVEPLGKLAIAGNKYATDKIKIVRELTKEEIYNENAGSNNVGWGNKGSCNEGYANKGDDNRGNCNKGSFNKGTCNKGDFNSGIYNRGDNNEGHYNRGDCNKGSFNNGDFNNGNSNIGIANKGNNQCGIGCTNAPLMLFNKPSKHTLEELRDSGALFDIMNHILTDKVRALDTFDMQVWNELGEEKKANEEH